jgi:hypothetical protein
MLTLKQCRRINSHFEVTELRLLGGGSVTDVGSDYGDKCSEIQAYNEIIFK